MKLLKRPMLGFALLAIGLFISVGAWNLIPYHQGPLTQIDNVDYVEGFLWGFLFPSSYVVLKVPDYLLRYLIIGVFTATVGITIMASSLLKRFAGIEHD
jgi:hypothetical protein